MQKNRVDSDPAELGELGLPLVDGSSAYISADPGDGKRYPAIIWIVGGFGTILKTKDGGKTWTPSLA